LQNVGGILDEDGLPFDDYIDQVSVPLLYVGPAGGIGASRVYPATFLGSSDVSLPTPRLLGEYAR
jgi:hypothetical protein